MAVLFVAGAISIFVGLEPIIGAFLAGLALNRYISDHSPLMNRIRFTANALFIPFFLLSVGMLMDLRVLVSNPDALLVTGLILITAIIGKILASWITSKVYGYSKVENRLIFGLSISQAAATLAATLVGYRIGLIDQQIVKDRKSTRLNSSHVAISYAVFCLKKKKKKNDNTTYMIHIMI